jgi:hypothetical protein
MDYLKEITMEDFSGYSRYTNEKKLNDELSVKMWAMSQALRHVNREGLTFQEHAEIARVFAMSLLIELKKLDYDSGNMDKG